MSVRGEEVVLTAEIRFRAPKAVYVVVSFGDCSNGPRVVTALPFELGQAPVAGREGR